MIIAAPHKFFPGGIGSPVEDPYLSVSVVGNILIFKQKWQPFISPFHKASSKSLKFGAVCTWSLEPSTP
jgi:hypothetical protein